LLLQVVVVTKFLLADTRSKQYFSQPPSTTSSITVWTS
jgi:hypothetical protein